MRVGKVYREAVVLGTVTEIPLPLFSAIVMQVTGAVIDVATAGCPGMTTDEVIDEGLRVLWAGIGA